LLLRRRRRDRYCTQAKGVKEDSVAKCNLPLASDCSGLVIGTTTNPPGLNLQVAEAAAANSRKLSEASGDLRAALAHKDSVVEQLQGALAARAAAEAQVEIDRRAAEELHLALEAARVTADELRAAKVAAELEVAKLKSAGLEALDASGKEAVARAEEAERGCRELEAELKAGQTPICIIHLTASRRKLCFTAFCPLSLLSG
jgi:hypothetical protein